MRSEKLDKTDHGLLYMIPAIDSPMRSICQYQRMARLADH